MNSVQKRIVTVLLDLKAEINDCMEMSSLLIDRKTKLAMMEPLFSEREDYKDKKVQTSLQLQYFLTQF